MLMVILVIVCMQATYCQAITFFHQFVKPTVGITGSLALKSPIRGEDNY